MTPKQIALLQQSWRLLRDLDPQLVGGLFYSKLFFDHPEVRKMFPADMTEQHGKLVSKFNLIIARLGHTADLVDEITAMAKRHAGYGVKPEHYAAVGTTLIWTLQRGLGDDWTPELANAWQLCYQELSTVMIKSSGQ